MLPARHLARLVPGLARRCFVAPAGPQRRFPLLSALVLALLIACGTATFVVQQYHGDPLPAERVAILRINGGDEARLAALDGEPLNYSLRDDNARVHIEMLPGQHELAVTEPITGLTQSRRFRAEPGKVYRVRIVRHRLQRSAGVPHTWSLAIDEVDRGTDEPRVAVPEPAPAVVRRAKPVSTPPATPPPAPKPAPPLRDAGVGGAPNLPEPVPLPDDPTLPSAPRGTTTPELPPAPRPLPLQPPPAVPLGGASGAPEPSPHAPTAPGVTPEAPGAAPKPEAPPNGGASGAPVR